MSEKNNTPEPAIPEVEPLDDDALDGAAGGFEGFCSAAWCSNSGDL